MVVGYNNVDVNAANKYGVAVGNTPVIVVQDYSGVSTRGQGQVGDALAGEIVDKEE
ncbi:hypothetical protein COLO4_33430 [Corchorus olitorius]|uniref:D-isomer specific 2-hydroxyacid dehydrogenase catalytic domain-containing protein n=1 Tax=Corchorus olitorius TaxID=93759 RepID=A0A1R3GTM5_9ROSI|nr:hypothetical protein COLO4_33430 [Corchorus olitorius]